MLQSSLEVVKYLVEECHIQVSDYEKHYAADRDTISKEIKNYLSSQ